VSAQAGDPNERFDVTGRVAIVTGGSRGLGREICIGLADAGAHIVVTSRRLDRCEDVAREIEARTGHQALAYACHVGHWDELDGLVDAAYATFGRVDVLVNNAGMSPIYSDLVDITEELYDKVLAVNLKGPFRLTALVGSRMREGGGGSIVNVSSLAAIRPSPQALPYAAAKAGVENLTLGFAHAFGPTVRVNAVMPGAFLTDIADHWDMESFAREAERYALRRGGRPDEVVGAVLYFASDASSYTTGASLRVDGGWP
jgi:NAD(P)-dependent dehydrogenase (short-subunit alcohol dehydrogenase family)